MKMKKIVLMFLFVFITINLQAVDVLQNYKFKDINGKIITMQTYDGGVYFPDFKGKAVLLNFFGYYCPPCLAEIPHLVKLQKAYKNKFQIIAIQVQKKMAPGALADFAKQHNINYTVIGMDDMKIFDLIDFITAKTGWRGQIPFMILMDKNGNALTTYLGKQKDETLIKDINTAIR